MGWLFQIERPPSTVHILDFLMYHLLLAAVSGIILLVSAVLPVDRIPFQLCAMARLTGYPCPTCGFTRGFCAMANGDWAWVWHNCPAAAAFYVLTALLFAWNMPALLFKVQLRPGTLFPRSGKGFWVWGGVAGLVLLANWVYRLAMHLK